MVIIDEITSFSRSRCGSPAHLHGALSLSAPPSEAVPITADQQSQLSHSAAAFLAERSNSARESSLPLHVNSPVEMILCMQRPRNAQYVGNAYYWRHSIRFIDRVREHPDVNIGNIACPNPGCRRDERIPWLLCGAQMSGWH